MSEEEVALGIVYGANWESPYEAEELSRVDLQSPVVLRSEYESLRQEYIRHMQFLASHEDMPEGLRNYCSRTLDFLEMDLDN